MKRQFVFYVVLWLAVCMLRVLPHPIGCTPIIAASLFFTSRAPKYNNVWMVLMPLFFLGTAVMQSGFWIGWWIQPISLFLILLFSKKFKLSGFWSYAALGLVSSIEFFILSNTGSWVVHALDYPMTFSGWLQCMEMGIPYFRPQLFWDVLFSVTIFFGYDIILKSKYFISPVNIVRPLSVS